MYEISDYHVFTEVLDFEMFVFRWHDQLYHTFTEVLIYYNLLQYNNVNFVIQWRSNGAVAIVLLHKALGYEF